MERWRGRVAVVTGASAGIGAQLVDQLTRAGLRVVGLARRLDLMEETAERLRAEGEPDRGAFHPVKCDLTREEEILEAFGFVEEQLGPVHVLVNNAGLLLPERIVDGSTDNFRKILDLNVLAVALCTREATKSMLKHEVRGHIVNVNSLGGHDAARVQVPLSLYCASKYAVTGMTESVRNELASLRSGIKITSVSPGPVRTNMALASGIPEELIDRVPILEPKDVADAIIYVLGTPDYVQVNELTITPLDESVL